MGIVAFLVHTRRRNSACRRVQRLAAVRKRRGRPARFMGNFVQTPHGSPIMTRTAQGKLKAPSPQPLAGGETSTERNRNMIPPVRGRRRALCARRGVLGAPCGGFVVVRGFVVFSVSFVVEVFCCVCVGCCGGGCGLASGFVALSSLLLCCVARFSFVVCRACVSPVLVLLGAGVVGSSVACRFSSLSVGGAAFRGFGVVVACVGFSSLLLGACRPVSFGVVGGVAGGGVACAPSCCCFSALRLRAGGRAPLSGLVPFFYAAKEHTGKATTRVPPPKASRNFGENCTPTARRKKKPILGPLRIRYAGHYTYRYSRQAEKSLKTNSEPHAYDSGVPFPATCRYRGFDVIAAFGGGLRGQEPRE